MKMKGTMEEAIQELAEKAANKAIEREGIYAAARFLLCAYQHEPGFRDAFVASVDSAIKDSSIVQLSKETRSELARKVTERIFGVEV